MTNEETAGFHPGHDPWAVALTVTLATFMEVMDTSIANVALPHIAGGLSAGQDESTWVLTSYLISNAIVLPMSAWFSERFGRKRFYMSGVALFTASSFLCGLAPSLGILVLFRVLQGVGGGGLGPSEQAILADTFPPVKRGMAFAYTEWRSCWRLLSARLWGMDYRQLQLAVDLLCECPFRAAISLSHQLHSAGSASHGESQEGIKTPSHRLHGPCIGWHRTRSITSGI